MANLDKSIDELYQLGLEEFTAARNALAKTLSGDDAARVKALGKPAVVPWAVNQVYWTSRSIFEKLLASGAKLRDAQLAALKGKSADIRAATDAHRHAIAAAVKEAERLAGASGSHPASDALMRTFEALSLVTTPPEPLGRLTRPLQPAGFEALAGVSPHAARPHLVPNLHAAKAHPENAREREAAERREAREREKAAAARAKELARADARAKELAAVAKRAQTDLERANDQLARAEEAVAEAKDRLKRAKAEADRAGAERDDLARFT